MYLSKEQKCTLQKIGIYQYAYKERDGKAYFLTADGEKEFIIPQFSEILQTMFEKIKNAGFTEIKRCKPSEANCIIRVFQKLHYSYDYEMCFNVYGAGCFTRMKEKWITHTGMNAYTLRYDQYIIRHILFQDESVYFDTDFLDCYVQIS